MLLELLVQDPEATTEVADLVTQLSAYLVLGLGAASAAIMSVLKKVVPKFNGLPDVAKSAIMPVLVAAGVVIGGFTGVEGLPANPLDFDVGSITLILASLSSMGLHAVWKAAKLPSINQPGV